MPIIRPSSEPNQRAEGPYRRTIESAGGVGTIEVRPDQEQARLMVRIELPKYDGLMAVVERVRQL
jgi:AlkA N-terminal domain